MWLGATLKSTHLAFPFLLVMMIISKPFIEIFFTQKYTEAVPIFQTYLLVGMWRNTQYGALIIASGKTRWTLYYSMVGLIFNVTVCILLFYSFGIIGIAWGSFLSAGFLSLLQLRHEGLLKEWFYEIILNKVVLLEITAIFVAYLCYNAWS